MNPQPKYFFYDDLLRLKNDYASLDDEARAALKARVALNSPDPEAAALFADIAGDDWANIYPPEPKEAPVSTVDAIDTFLETYGHSSPEEDAMLEKLIFNPTPDFSGVLEAEAAANPSEAPDDLTSSRIDSFIASHPAGSGVATHEAAPAPQAEPAPQPAPEAVAETAPTAVPAVEPAREETRHEPKAQRKAPAPAPSSLSESLAKIYIKQGKYSRAFEIISDLNLKNPEKSIYFADQLRFLKKLMLIQERAAAAQGKA